MSHQLEQALREELERLGMNPRKVKRLRNEVSTMLRQYEEAMTIELRENA